MTFQYLQKRVLRKEIKQERMRQFFIQSIFDWVFRRKSCNKDSECKWFIWAMIPGSISELREEKQLFQCMAE